MKPIRRVCIGIIVALVATDLVGHVYYRVRKGKYLWNADEAFLVFQVRPFATLVDDARVTTLKKSFQFEDVTTDANGFRTSVGSYEGKAGNVVFIGDSVPFGWGVPDELSIPSHFARLLERKAKTHIGVINAAVPSYSLNQAVKRYEYEVHERFPVLAVVLQTWDPASQLVLQGKAWAPEMNWNTYDAERTPLQRSVIRLRKWLRFSSFAYYGFRAGLQVLPARPQLSVNDHETRDRFIRENVRTLGELGALLQKHGTPLYLLPANPASGISESGNPQDAALRWLNESLRTYARSAELTHFVDVVEYFDQQGRAGLFGDDCCHLTSHGNALQAELIYREMYERGDLE